MTAIPPDYDADPARAASWDPSWVVGDVYAGSGERIAGERLAPVLDVGAGTGGFAATLPVTARWIGLDASATQLAKARRPVVRGDARLLPFADETFGAVACHWMLYHLEAPERAIAEAHRVLRRGGLFVASTSARNEDPELLPGGYPPTTFDAEDAPGIVAAVFGAVEVERWDGPFNVLPDRSAVLAYARHHSLPADVADRVRPPITLTKRGCLVWARRR